MQSVLFTKMFKGLSVDEMAAHIAQLGFDGVDLLIRDGHQLTPNAPAEIAATVARLHAAGLTVPMATADFTEASDEVEALLTACRDSGIGLMRIGYYRYPGTGYTALVDEARRKLDGLARLAGRIGIRLALQLHGGTIHASSCQTLRLLEGHDPAILSTYPDPGNQAVQEGRENWRFTFDALGPTISCIGVKNGGWFASDINQAGQRTWHSDWLGLPCGMVPWDALIAHLKSSKFNGLLTFHSHYKIPLDAALDQTRTDLRHINRLLEAQQ